MISNQRIGLAYNLLYCLQNCVEADGVKLEDCSLKAFHKVPNGLGSSHSNVKKTSEAQFSPY